MKTYIVNIADDPFNGTNNPREYRFPNKRQAWRFVQMNIERGYYATVNMQWLVEDGYEF